MEELVGPHVEVVLTLKEVTNLTFVNGPVFAVAKFSDNQMETDVKEADTVVVFNTDLIWETNKQNIKRMRNNNIPIKVYLCKYINENQHEKLGYVVVNLRTAQYVPKGKFVRVKEENVKVLGLGKEAKGCTPQICLSLKIQDKVSNIEPHIGYDQAALSDVRFESQGDDVKNDLIDDNIPVRDVPNPAPEEAPVHDMVDDEEPVSITVPFVSASVSSRSPRTKHSIPTNVVEERHSVNGDDTKNSSGDLQPPQKFVEAYHKFNLKVHLQSIIWYKVPQKFRFRFHQSRSEILSTAHPDIHVDRANESINLFDIKAIFNFVETPAEFYKLLNSVPPMVSISCNSQNGPVIIARGLLKTERLIATGSEKFYETELTDAKNHDPIGKLTYAASLRDCGPQVMKDLTLKIKPDVEEEDLPPAIFSTVTDKIVDELEDWKERQKQLFQQEFTKKLKKEISELREEWLERRRVLEEKLNQNIEQCRILGNSLITATEDVKQKGRECMEKEKHLEITKSELELRYLKLLTDKNDEAEKLKTEYFTCIGEKDTRIAALETEKAFLENQLKALTRENEELKVALKQNENEMEKNKRACLSQEQTATLLQDLKTMQEKMEAANNSKLFFKEQWGRAVREIHRIKSEYTKNIKVQLQYRKDELKKLGLEQLFLIEKNKNNLERDDMLEAKDFLGNDFETKNTLSDIDFLHNSKANETFKTNMDIVKESNTYLLKFNQESEERLKRLIDERDKLLCEQNCPIDDERIAKLNKEIRHLLDH